jgi:quercetin dioxygenase-like cupin family protein
MSEPASRPRTQSKVVAESPEIRVVEFTLQAGEALPWHFHSEITDRFYCLEGEIAVEFDSPVRTTILHPGESLSIEPKTVHRPRNTASGISRYLLVQGVGRYDFITAPKPRNG